MPQILFSGITETALGNGSLTEGKLIARQGIWNVLIESNLISFLFHLILTFPLPNQGTLPKAAFFFIEWSIMLGICICMDVKPLAGKENCTTRSNEDAQYKKHFQVNWVQEPTLSSWSKKRNQNCICHHQEQARGTSHASQSFIFALLHTAEEKVSGGKWHHLTIPNSLHKI